MYYLTSDGEYRQPISSNLAAATDVFWSVVHSNDWFCPALEDDEGVVLAFWANDTDDGGLMTFIGPQEDPNPEPGIDRQWEESYRTNSSSITGIFAGP